MSIVNINLILPKRQCIYSCEGMLMLELLVSILLVSIFTLVIVYYQGLIMQWQQYTLEHTKIAHSIHNFLENARFDSKILSCQEIRDGVVNLQWSLRGTPVPEGLPAGTQHATRLKIIQVKGWISDYRKGYTVATGIII